MIRGLSLDLDDTLWPVAPVIHGAELALHRWLEAHVPQVAASFPVEAMRQLRPEAFTRAAVAGRVHDLGWIRRTQIGLAFERSGLGTSADPLIEQAYAVFQDARQQVQLYPEVRPALARIAARIPIAAVTNGTSDLSRMDLAPYFRAIVSAGTHGAAKPSPTIFVAACEELELPCSQVLHVGDDPTLDVLAAANAGLQAGWLNRSGLPWSLDMPLVHDFRSLAEVAALVGHNDSSDVSGGRPR